MLLIVDNYDSFVHNLARYLQRLGQESLVFRNDAINITDVRRLRPSAILLSPGPCTPDEAGACLEIVRTFAAEIPILGVCLGHQVIGQAFGASVVRASRPVHGRSSWVHHASDGLFTGLPSPLRVGRYHSLVVDRQSLPDALHVTATTDDGLIMAFQHQSLPTFGVQFHPESVLTQYGYRLLAAFLDHAGIVHPPADTLDVTEKLAYDGLAKRDSSGASRSSAAVSWPDAYPVRHWKVNDPEEGKTEE